MDQAKPATKLLSEHAFDDFARRTMDIVLSLVAMILLFPVFLLVAIIVRNTSPGPILYRAPRAGRFGKTFLILKFRTMFETPESYNGPKVTGRTDKRITPIGKFLRETKLNEIPQFWNVLIGEMALVGPRPEDVEIVESWPEKYKEQILSVRPGITSPASIVYRWEEELLHSENVMDQYLNTILPDKLQIDAIYTQRRSLLVDLDILFLTVAVLFPMYSEVTLNRDQFYWGPISRLIAKYLNWFAIDMLVSFTALLLAGFLWRLEYPLDIGIAKFFVIAFSTGLIFSITNFFLGLHKISWNQASYTEIFPLSISVAFSYSALLFFDHVLTEGNVPYPWLAFELPVNVYIRLVTFAWFGFILTRYNHRIFTGVAYRLAKLGGTAASLLRGRVLLVGAGQNANFAVWLLNNHFFKKFSISGMVDDEPRKMGMNFYGVQVLGTTNDIPALVKKLGINLIVFTIKQIESGERKRLLDLCQSTGLPVVLIPDILDEVEKRFEVLNEIPLL